ncbi:MAG: alpha/beta fold hydrolase, partial [Candidatus Eisenbacteria bacterium]
MSPEDRRNDAGRRRATMRRVVFLAMGAALALLMARSGGATEGDAVFRDFRFHCHVVSGVLILHGTGGSGRQFLARSFADELYGLGAPLDTTRWYVILPDGIGHGRSSKPSDGLHAHFPAYDYDDMVEAQYRLLTERLSVRHLRLVMGTSMGGMQTWMWGEAHPEFMDALMPLACLPVAIVGRNRLWREMIVEAIRQDPEWKNGDYVEEPRGGLRTAVDL